MTEETPDIEPMKTEERLVIRTSYSYNDFMETSSKLSRGNSLFFIFFFFTVELYFQYCLILKNFPP